MRSLTFSIPGHRQQPVQIIAADRGFRRHRRHELQPLQFLDRLFVDFLGHPGRVDLFLQLVDFALFAASQLFLNGLQLFVQVILFLRPLHLPLHPRVDVAVDVQFFQLNVQNVPDAVQPLQGIHCFQQILLFIYGKLQVGGDRVREPRRIIYARGGDHGVVIQALGKLDELFVEAGHLFDDLLDLRRILHARPKQPHRRAEESFFRGDGQRPRAFHAFHQDFDIAIRQLDALHDVSERSDGVNLFRLGVVDRSVVLRGKENFLIAGQRFFKRAHAGFAADDKRSHLLREDDHVAHRHHRHALHFLFFTSEHSSPWTHAARPGWGPQTQFDARTAYPAFSSKLQLISRVRTISAVTTKSRTFRCMGRWYINSSMRSSRIIRKPRAPTLR